MNLNNEELYVPLKIQNNGKYREKAIAICIGHIFHKNWRRYKQKPNIYVVVLSLF